MFRLLSIFLFALVRGLAVANPLPAEQAEPRGFDIEDDPFSPTLVERQAPGTGPQVAWQTYAPQETRFAGLPPIPYWPGKDPSTCTPYGKNQWAEKGLTREVGSVPITPATNQLPSRRRSLGWKRDDSPCYTIASFKFANWTEEVANTFPLQNLPGGYDYLIAYTTNAVVKHVEAWLHSPINGPDCCYQRAESNTPRDYSFGTLQWTYPRTIDVHYKFNFAYQHEPVPINGVVMVLRRPGRAFLIACVARS
ncbi:MAG: hypothetical protein LQ351_000577 [Letrouitia transgressa]|nr:MAG: hypothetical protein LQ351_000577 [Letrouitia transgressa]